MTDPRWSHEPTESPVVRHARPSEAAARVLSRQGATESAVVQASVQEYLDRDVKDNVIIMRRLDRVARAAGRHEREWLESLPEVRQLRGRQVRGRRAPRRDVVKEDPAGDLADLAAVAAAGDQAGT